MISACVVYATNTIYSVFWVISYNNQSTLLSKPKRYTKTRVNKPDRNKSSSSFILTCFRLYSDLDIPPPFSLFSFFSSPLFQFLGPADETPRERDTICRISFRFCVCHSVLLDLLVPSDTAIIINRKLQYITMYNVNIVL